MTANQIANLVKEQADARLDEVVERLLPILKNRHTHESYMGECGCAYCHFIKHEYTNFKLLIHKLKKRIRYLEWCNNDVDIRSAWKAEQDLALQQLVLFELKRKKKQLKEG